MYAQSTQLSGTKSFLPSPASDELSNSESDLIPLLEDKQREIDKEIETFKSRKEEEFKAFEHELRSHKKQNNQIPFPYPTTQISGLSNLCKKGLAMNGSGSKERKKRAEDVIVGGLMPTGPSRPSVSVDKVTINGMTTPPVSGTPPLGKNMYPSPTLSTGTPPRHSPEKETGRSPPIPERGNEFHGLFTPGYLQLLDTKPSSLPQTALPSSLSESKRAVTNPTLPSTSLPSALRPASKASRKRKHVTFRLADSVVVEPSSSYEETPSPSEDQYGRDLHDAGPGLGIEIMPSPSPIEIPESYSNKNVISPNKTDNEASFFSFDEELDEEGNEFSEEPNVSRSRRLFSRLYELTQSRTLKMMRSSWMKRKKDLNHRRSSRQHFRPVLFLSTLSIPPPLSEKPRVAKNPSNILFPTFTLKPLYNSKRLSKMIRWSSMSNPSYVPTHHNQHAEWMRKQRKQSQGEITSALPRSLNTESIRVGPHANGDKQLL